MNLCTKDWRNPQPDGRAENMTQWKRVQEAERMNILLVAQVLPRAILNGADTRQHIAVSVHNAFGITSGAGGEENLQRRFATQLRNCALPRLRKDRIPLLKADSWNGKTCFTRKLPQKKSVTNGEFWLHIGCDASGEISAAVCVEGNYEDTA